MKLGGPRFWRGPGLLIVFAGCALGATGVVYVLAAGPRLAQGLLFLAGGVVLLMAAKQISGAMYETERDYPYLLQDRETMKRYAEAGRSFNEVAALLFGYLFTIVGMVMVISEL